MFFMIGKATFDETVVIVYRFHDLYKVHLCRGDKRNKKINGAWIEVPYYVVNEEIPIWRA